MRYWLRVESTSEPETTGWARAWELLGCEAGREPRSLVNALGLGEAVTFSAELPDVEGFMRCLAPAFLVTVLGEG